MSNELILVFISVAGWVFAVVQFILTYGEGRLRSDENLLEQTLGYFERGTQARSIGISLVQSVWLTRKKNLDVIVPVLVSQLIFLLRDADEFGQESRNLIRILRLLEECLPHTKNAREESIEIMEALLEAGNGLGKISVTSGFLEIWYQKFGGERREFKVLAGISDDDGFLG
jgi:hypothetical protein